MKLRKAILPAVMCLSLMQTAFGAVLAAEEASAETLSADGTGTAYAALRGSDCEHGDKTRVPERKATCRQDGMKEYYHCNLCDLDFDASGNRIWDLNSLKTYSNHSDKDAADGKCDFCGKNMPIFKRVTDKKGIIGGGTYVLAAEIGGRSYALQAPPEGEHGRAYDGVMPLCEITPDENGNFEFNALEENGVLMFEPEFAAEGSPMDAGKPRYGLNTVLDSGLYELAADGGAYFWTSEKHPGEPIKYGFRIELDSSGAALIGSVYAEWWNKSETTGSGLLRAFDMTYEGTAKRFMTFMPEGEYNGDGAEYSGAAMTACPIYLYQMTDVGKTTNGITFTVNDVNSNVNNGSFIIDEDGKLSYVQGIADAVDEITVAELIDEEVGAAHTSVAVQLCADIQATAAEDGAVTYSVVPQLDVLGADGSLILQHRISDDCLNGSPITITLHTGGISPAQIIHFKEDGTKEYFYEEWSEKVRNGAKSFKYANNFVTITVDSFSEIKILETAEEEGMTVTARGIDAAKYSVSGQTVTVTHDKPCRLGYLDGGKYTAAAKTKIDDGKYSFTVPDGVAAVILVVKGDVNGDGNVNSADSTAVDKATLPLLHPLHEAITKEAAFAADVDGNGMVNSADSTFIDLSILPASHAVYKALEW